MINDSRSDCSKPYVTTASTPPASQQKLHNVRVKDVMVLQSRHQADAGSPPSGQQDNAVEILLRMICTEPPAAAQEEVQCAIGYRVSRPDLRVRTLYELQNAETLSDIARRYYGEAAVAGLIFRLNSRLIDARPMPGHKLRLRLNQGIVLELPTYTEAQLFLDECSSPIKKQRCIIYEIA